MPGLGGLRRLVAMWKLTEDKRLVLSVPDRIKVDIEANTKLGEVLPHVDFGDEVELPGGIKKRVIALYFDRETYPYSYSPPTGREILTLELVSPETFVKDCQEGYPSSPFFDPYR